MHRYSYTALKSNGKTVSDEMMANSLDEVILRLKHQNALVIEINEKKELKTLFKRKNWKLKDIIKLSIQMRMFIEAGISIHVIIDLLNKGDKKTSKFQEIKEYITQGKSLSEALKYVKFPKLAVTLVKAGEASGDLAQAFKNIQIHYENKMRLRDKIIQISLYPSFILLLLLAFFILAIEFIFPTFINIFMSMNVELPYILKVVEQINKSNLFFKIITINFIGIIGVFLALKKIKKLRYFIDKLLWQIMRKYVVYGGYLYVRVFSVIALLLNAGIPLVESLNISKNLWNNLYLEHKTDLINKALNNGEAIVDAFKKEGIGTSVFYELIKAGSLTGELDLMFEKSAKYYSEAVTHKLKKIEVCIEPILMSIIGISIALVVLMIMLPLFDAMQAMGNL